MRCGGLAYLGAHAARHKVRSKERDLHVAGELHGVRTPIEAPKVGRTKERETHLRVGVAIVQDGILVARDARQPVVAVAEGACPRGHTLDHQVRTAGGGTEAGGSSPWAWQTYACSRRARRGPTPCQSWR